MYPKNRGRCPGRQATRLNILTGPEWEVAKVEMKSLIGVEGLSFELPRAMEERAREASRSEGGFEAVRLE
jgi:hypothetical protein